MRRIEEEDVFSMSFTDVLTCVLVSSIFLFLIFVALVRTESASSLIDGARAPVESADAQGREAIALGGSGRVPIIVRVIGDAPLDEHGWVGWNAAQRVSLRSLDVDPARSGLARFGSELFIPSWQNQFVSYQLLKSGVRSNSYDANLAVWVGGNCFSTTIHVPDEATFHRNERTHAVGSSVELFRIRMQDDSMIESDYAANDSMRMCE
jgi:hypothetical protein